jgi:hypothetical protein
MAAKKAPKKAGKALKKAKKLTRTTTLPRSGGQGGIVDQRVFSLAGTRVTVSGRARLTTG